MIVFDKYQVFCFCFVCCDFVVDIGVVWLVYVFDDGLEMVEIIIVFGVLFVLDLVCVVVVQCVLQLLYLIVGVSYYKVGVLDMVSIDSYSIDVDIVVLVEIIYFNGLGEFVYCNGLNLCGCFWLLVQGVVVQVLVLGLQLYVLVVIGGGKDLLVSIEVLCCVGVDEMVIWIGGLQLICVCVECIGLLILNLGCMLVLELFELNCQGVWNGYILVMVVNLVIMVLVVLLYGVDQVVFFNECLVSYGSQILGIGEVNYQWFKGWVCEQVFGSYVWKYVVVDLQYYLLLCLMFELVVVCQFVKIDFYDVYFFSCNCNFYIFGECLVNCWCGVCLKCYFVFLVLVLFMFKMCFVCIFGCNLLDDVEQVVGFDVLLEFQDYKLFECVGEGCELCVVMVILVQCLEWKEDVLVKCFCNEIQLQLDVVELELVLLLQLQGEYCVLVVLWEWVCEDFEV